MRVSETTNQNNILQELELKNIGQLLTQILAIEGMGLDSRNFTGMNKFCNKVLQSVIHNNKTRNRQNEISNMQDRNRQKKV